ncbi:MAG TPA: PPOX class F420-dependent oxidoreductase [Candidatus Binataceae bacterium]|nr:PPOX class F420-dependent oxidoreductase [Candidatus Binataceae bacterium]
MASKIPAKYLDLFTDKVAFAVLATVMPDGSPQATPLWFDFRSDTLRINTAVGRRKERNLDSNPKVALVVMDPANPYRYVQLRGHVTRRTDGPPAEQHIDILAKKYLNQERYPHRAPGERRVMYEVAIDSCQVMG